MPPFLRLVCSNALTYTNIATGNLIKNNGYNWRWQEQVEQSVQSQYLAATDEYFSNNNIMQSPILRLTYTASPAGLRFPPSTRKSHWCHGNGCQCLGLNTLHDSSQTSTQKKRSVFYFFLLKSSNNSYSQWHTALSIHCLMPEDWCAPRDAAWYILSKTMLLPTMCGRLLLTITPHR